MLQHADVCRSTQYQDVAVLQFSNGHSKPFVIRAIFSTCTLHILTVFVQLQRLKATAGAIQCTLCPSMHCSARQCFKRRAQSLSVLNCKMDDLFRVLFGPRHRLESIPPAPTAASVLMCAVHTLVRHQTLPT